MEHGHIAAGEGSRTDVQEFYDKLKSGMNDLELMEQDFNSYARFQKAVDRYRTLKPIQRIDHLEVHLFIGEPGTGKTRRAYDLCPTIYSFPIGPTLWADGYMGQPVVLVDDFSGQLRLVDTLRFLDRYPIQIPRKGGFSWWCPSRIIITSNIHPAKWYKWEDRQNQEYALQRRIHKIWDFDNIDEDGDPAELDKDSYWPVKK